MSEVYNPETGIVEQIEALEVEARALRVKLDDASSSPASRSVYSRQLKEMEARIAALRRQIRP